MDGSLDRWIGRSVDTLETRCCYLAIRRLHYAGCALHSGPGDSEYSALS